VSVEGAPKVSPESLSHQHNGASTADFSTKRLWCGCSYDEMKTFPVFLHQHTHTPASQFLFFSSLSFSLSVCCPHGEGTSIMMLMSLSHVARHSHHPVATFSFSISLFLLEHSTDTRERKVFHAGNRDFLSLTASSWLLAAAACTCVCLLLNCNCCARLR
jgi:hypothetical protein